MKEQHVPRRLRAPIVMPCDISCTVLRDAVVDIGADGRILNVSTMDDAPAWTGAEQNVSGILLPGLINAHAHSSMSVLRGRGGDLPLIAWLREAMWPAEALMTPADVRAGMLLGSIEMLRNALMHIHLAETGTEDEAQRARFGSVPALLESVGLVASRLLAAHAVHLSDGDIDRLAGAGVAVAHCPSSNAKLASGVMRLSALRAAGVPVGLGTDGPASNDRLDLLDEARTAALLARVTDSDPGALTAADALLLATRGGAEALGRDDIGVLEAGRWADVVHVGVDDPAFATGLEVSDEELIANLVWAAGARTVTDVWVAGDAVVSESESVRVDRQRAQAEVAAAAARLRLPAAVGNVKEVRPSAG